MARIFLSHSSRDNQAAAEIKNWLDELQFTCTFLDFDKHSGIEPGADWEKTLYTELERAQAILILQTSNWVESKWCFAEFTQARALGKKIFPMILEPRGETTIGSDLQRIDLTRDRDAGLASLKDALLAIGQTGPAGFTLERDTSPFPGLTAFDTDQAAVFFGRNDEIRDGLDRLRAVVAHGDPRFLVVLGASGSGKSSLLRAGLIPRLKRDRLNWIVLDPIRPGTQPAWTLTERLILATGADHAAQHDGWRAALAGVDAGAALAGITRALRQRHASALDATILLPVDQLEEAFTLSDAAEKAGFFRLLTALLTQDLPVAVIATMRADHLEALATASERLATPALLHLPPMPVARIEELIRGPARVAGLTVEDSLVSTLQYDARTANALPLVAFALNRLYESKAQASGRLTLADYEALGPRTDDVPPLVSAIRTHAEMIITTPALSTDAETALREAFISCLARVSSDSGTIIRRPAPRHTLPAAALPSIDRLIDARLLTSAPGDGGGTVIEVSHEALLTAWPRIARWLDEEHDYLLGRERLRQVFEHWKTLPETDKPRALLTGLLLDRARTWLKTHPGRFADPAEAGFVTASVDAAEAEVRHRQEMETQATTAFRVALRAANALIIDVQNFEDGGSASRLAIRILQRIEEFMKELYVIKNHMTGLEYTRALALDEMSLRFSNSGMLKPASWSAQQALDIMRKLSERHPDFPEFKIELAISLNSFGTLLLKTDPQKARETIDECLLIAREVLAREPHLMKAKRTLIDALRSMGDITSRTNLADARSIFEEELIYSEEIAAILPKDPDIQKGLGISLVRMGNFLSKTDHSAAHIFYERALSISEMLSENAPYDADLKRNVSLTLEYLGTNICQENPDIARMYYERSFHIINELSISSPEDIQLQYDLSTLLERMANLDKFANPGRAYELFCKTLAISRKISAASPNNLQFKHALLVSLINNSDYLILENSRPLIEEAMEISQFLLNEEPQNPIFLAARCKCIEKYGKFFMINDKEKAIDLCLEGLEIARNLLRIDPKNIEYLVNFQAFLFFANNFKINSDQTKILEVVNEEILTIDSLIITNPENIAFKNIHFVSLTRAGDLTTAVAPEKSRQFYSQAIQIARDLIQLQPHNILHKQNLFLVLTNFGILLFKSDARSAHEIFNEGLEIINNLIRENPENPQFYTQLAMSLVRRAHIGNAPAERFREALNVLHTMNDCGLLAPDQRPWIDEIQGHIAEVDKS